MVSLFAPIVWDLTWLFSLTLLVCSVLLWLRTQPARNMSQMRSLLARAAAVPTYQGQLSQLEHELKRARRYQHSFSVIVLMLEPSYDAAGMSDHSAQMARIAMIPVMVCLVRETLRETDVLTYDAALNRCIVATAGSSGDAAQLVSRLCTFSRGARSSFAPVWRSSRLTDPRWKYWSIKHSSRVIG